MADGWQTLAEISARGEWGKRGVRTKEAAFRHAVSHVGIAPEFVRSTAAGRAYSPGAVEIIVLCLRGRGLAVDGRMATIGEREAAAKLHGRIGH